MKALAGKRIVITRAAHQAGELEQLLLEREAVPLLYPCIDIQPPEDRASVDATLQAALDGQFDWLVLTSSNTVRALKQRLESIGGKDTALKLKVAAVGKATAAYAEAVLGLKVDIIPDEYDAKGLAQALKLSKNIRVLLPQSAMAEPALAAALSNMGAIVTQVTAYQTVIGQGGVDLPALLRQGAVDAITFTSPSTVTYLLQRLEREGGDRQLLESVCAACIGRNTIGVVVLNRLPITVAAAQQTLEGLVSALEHYYAALAIGESK